MSDLVRSLRGALGYTRQYRDQVFVIKLGGEVLADATILHGIAEQVALLESLSIRLVLVHGGGTQASALSRRLGIEPEIVAGRRVTSPAVLEIAKMVYGGSLSLDILAALRASGLRAVGLSGVDALLLTARRRPPVEVRDDEGRLRTVDFGEVGDIVSVDAAVLRALLDARTIPVVGPLAAEASGRVLNVNGDAVAESLAGALRAEKLIFLTSAPGLLRDRTDPGSLVSFAEAADLEPLLGTGAVQGGMRPKVEACLRAVQQGVRRTHILDGREPDALLLELFTGSGRGTMIVGRKEMADYREHEWRTP